MTDLPNIIIPRSAILETEQFMRERGRQGYEARAYWLGTRQPNQLVVKRTYITEQMAEKSYHGVSVSVSQAERLKLVQNLKSGEEALVKLHTHPAEAYMSPVDIANPSFKFKGAVSIVVPDFAKAALGDLSHCSVNIFQNGNWYEFTRQEILQHVGVIENG